MSREDSAPPSPALQWAILAVLTTATALYAMTVTIANVALPQMQGALSATTDQIAWVVTFNIVATAVATPTTGWLTARLGRRRLMVWGIALFTVASFLCGTAGSLEELVLYRIVQGLVGAPLVPLSQAIVLDTFSRERQGTAMAVFGMGVVIGPIIAPTLGGYLSENYGWRWVFFMIVPFGMMSFAGVWAFVTEKGRAGAPRLDWTGFLALSVAIASLQLMLDRGERNDWFSSPEIIIEAALAVLGLWVFLSHSLTTERPFINMRLFLDRNYSIGLCFTLIFGMLNFTPMVLFPPLLQDLRDYPDSVIGLLLAARGAGTLLGFTIMLWGSKLDPRFWLFMGFMLQGGAGIYMSGFDINLTTESVGWATGIQGLGVGLIWVPLTQITFATLDPKLLPESTAFYHLVRNFGSSIFISISIAVVIRTAKQNYADFAADLTPYREALEFPFVRGAWDLSTLQGLAAFSGEMQRQALMIGYINAFLLFAITAFAGMPLLLLVRRHRPAAQK